ncbi:MAG: hypothetical protein ISQ15_09640 [Ilumatobacteraceae bacterium]|nr:hypothetical protein [Ilumatobacteraceae bacterium]
MANTLRAARDELALLLSGAGVSCFPYLPEKVTPPVAVIEPGSPYMVQGDTFESFTVRFNVIILAAPATNETATAALDQAVCDVIDAVDTFYVDNVEQPSSFTTGGADFLGTRIEFSVVKPIET